MAKFKFVEWLLLWLQENSHFEFDWDEGNRTKSAAKHSVRTEEAEEVFTDLSAPDPLTRRRENSMKPTYAKSEKAYASTSEFERKKILAAAKRLKKSRKLPTSIALEESTINELKALAEWRGVPYQVLMRMFILDGLHKSQAAVAR